MGPVYTVLQVFLCFSCVEGSCVFLLFTTLHWGLSLLPPTLMNTWVHLWPKGHRYFTARNNVVKAQRVQKEGYDEWVKYDHNFALNNMVAWRKRSAFRSKASFGRSMLVLTWWWQRSNTSASFGFNLRLRVLNVLLFWFLILTQCIVSNIKDVDRGDLASKNQALELFCRC